MEKKYLKISDLIRIIMVRDFFIEGSGDDNHVKSTYTQYNGNEIMVQYSQIDGVDIDGIDSKSDEVLFHEFVHAKDFLDGTFDKIVSDQHQSSKTRGQMEARAVKQTNDYRIDKSNNRPLRKTYRGIPVVNDKNSIILGTIEIY